MAERNESGSGSCTFKPLKNGALRKIRATTRNFWNAGRLFFDLLNEPDAFNMLWGKPNTNPNGGVFGTVPAWGALYTQTADALLQEEPELLFLVEGTGQKLQPGTAFGKSYLFARSLGVELRSHSPSAQERVQNPYEFQAPFDKLIEGRGAKISAVFRRHSRPDSSCLQGWGSGSLLLSSLTRRACPMLEWACR